jgi:CubicO group peptidase (beta-lactamase class C family)
LLEGLLDLDVPIQKYVLSFPDKGAPITVRELLVNLCVVRHYADKDFGGHDDTQTHYPTLTGALDIFQNDPLVTPTKAKWLYSSYGYNLVGVALEHVGHGSFLTVLRQVVLDPLDMQNTAGDEYERIVAHRARFYEVGEDGKYHNAPYADLSYKYPSGGLLSTPTDLVTFGSAMIHSGLLKESTRRMLFTSGKTTDGQETGYGLGWQLKSEGAGPKGERYFWHRGAVVGGHAALVIYPDSDVAAACAENTTPCECSDFNRTHRQNCRTIYLQELM